uniref:Uncharacterized protein n=1 Tax=Rhizophora mucronata TaxID=61149 RepID=A0A2P2N960_RHIMU
MADLCQSSAHSFFNYTM